MELKERDCEDCDLDVELSGSIRVDLDDNKMCRYQFSLSISNTNSYGLYVTISNPDGFGVLVPSTIYIPPASSSLYPLSFYPLGTFVGGSIDFIVAGKSADGEIMCKQGLELFLPEFICLPPGARQGFVENNDLEKTAAGILQVIPNPAKNNTQIRYKFNNTDTESEKTIEVYDLVGRPVKRFENIKNDGIVSLDLATFPSGYYIILLKESGKVIQQQKLIVQ